MNSEKSYVTRLFNILFKIPDFVEYQLKKSDIDIENLEIVMKPREFYSYKKFVNLCKSSFIFLFNNSFTSIFFWKKFNCFKRIFSQCFCE